LLTIQELKRIIIEDKYLTGEGDLTRVDLSAAYLDMLGEKIKLGPRKPRVVVDCGNGTASLFAETFLQGIGCKVIPLYCESDGNFPNHHPDPVKRNNLLDLISCVVENKADLGVAYDGDGDRLGVVDNMGNVVWGDDLMILYWREILPQHPGTTAIVEVKCSQALVDEVIRLGGKVHFYKTGHSLIKAKMKELGSIFTGEMSGHMFFADEYFGYDDALYATGRLLRILSHTEKSLSGLLEDAPKYCSTGETRMPCSDLDKFEVVNQLTCEFQEQYEVIDIDGARVLFPEGWALVRCSNTQPVIVARCEANSPEALDKIKKIMEGTLHSYPQIGVFDWE
jgi:phosphomannomutase/phosphoglucomutase